MSDHAMRRSRSIAMALVLASASPAVMPRTIDLSGFVSAEPRFFLEKPLFPDQSGDAMSASVVVAPELRVEWDDGDQRFTLSPYLRLDAHDSRRTHADLREASWLYVDGPLALQVGLGKVFWGVTESRHLVDIVNQTDLVEDIDEEDKLGQPMISIERWADTGTWTLYLLTGFRERTFPEEDARLSGGVPVDVDRAEFESGAENRRLDLALRWSHSVGDWDLGVAAFHGTAREPRLLPRASLAGGLVLVPHYDVIGQLGIDVQYTKGAWLWKLESFAREGHGATFGAAVAGFEYTIYGLAQGRADLGLLAEYLYDGRGADAPPTIYDSDWFAGVRLAFNDSEDTAILVGAIVDGDGTFAVVEVERRLGERWKLEAEARVLMGVDETDGFLSGYRKDSFITLRLARFF